MYIFSPFSPPLFLSSDLSLSISSSLIVNGVFRGVLSIRIPWKTLFGELEVTVADRPNSYYFIVKRDGNLHVYMILKLLITCEHFQLNVHVLCIIFILLGVMLYHSRYPKVYVPDIDPTTIETSEAFPTIMSAIIK